MSIEAMNWARSADVKKSSSKIVLLNLAMLVRYDAEEWTMFASIDYLAQVTHLNRKTVIEALARLREMGVLQNTGRRAGANRCCIIYRLCPNAVPMVNASRTVDVEADREVHGRIPDWVWRGSAPDLPKESTTQEDVAGAGQEEVIGAEDIETLTVYSRCPAVESNPEDTAADGTSALNDNDKPDVISSHQIAPLPSRSKDVPTATAGPGGTRLPTGWLLPEAWRNWTQCERKHWSREKIDAVATTFFAYMRSRPGDLGISSDWFASWRLWVFREREVKAARKSWQETWSGIVAKGKTLGLVHDESEPAPRFKQRVYEAAGLSMAC